MSTNVPELPSIAKRRGVVYSREPSPNPLSTNPHEQPPKLKKLIPRKKAPLELKVIRSSISFDDLNEQNFPDPNKIQSQVRKKIPSDLDRNSSDESNPSEFQYNENSKKSQESKLLQIVPRRENQLRQRKRKRRRKDDQLQLNNVNDFENLLKMDEDQYYITINHLQYLLTNSNLRAESAFLQIIRLRDEKETLLVNQRKSDQFRELLETIEFEIDDSLNLSNNLTILLKSILNRLQIKFGGVHFLGILNIQENHIIGATKNPARRRDVEFLNYIVSSNGQKFQNDFKVVHGFGHPRLRKVAILRSILQEKNYRIISQTRLRTPGWHFPLKTPVFIPIVVKNKSVALYGCSHSSMVESEVESFFKNFPKVWDSFILKAVVEFHARKRKLMSVKILRDRSDAIVQKSFEFRKILHSDSKITGNDRKALSTLLDEKLRNLINHITDSYGYSALGTIWILNTIANNQILEKQMDMISTSGSDSDSDGGESVGSNISNSSKTSSQKKRIREKLNFKKISYMKLVFSRAAQNIRDSSMKGFDLPQLKNQPYVQKFFRSKNIAVYIGETGGGLLKLPNKHIPLGSLMLVKVISADAQPVAILGIANGINSSQAEAEILHRCISDCWRDLRDLFLRRQTTAQKMILKSTLPKSIIKRLSNGEIHIADTYRKVSVMFVDIIGFTKLSKGVKPGIIVKFLNTVFIQFDSLMKEYHIEKVKTLGDGYVCVGGIFNRKSKENNEFVQNTTDAALAMLKVVETMNLNKNKELINNTKFGIRIGIATGSVNAGVFGSDKKVWDVFGETVNRASRLEQVARDSTGKMLLVDKPTFEHLHSSKELNKCYTFYKTTKELKGLGKTECYFCTPPKTKHNVKKETLSK